MIIFEHVGQPYFPLIFAMISNRKPALFSRLNLEIDAEGNLASVEPDKPRYFFSSSEPNKSIWERQAIEEKRRLKVLRADLKEIDKWLKDISNPSVKLVTSALKLP
ncbi:hypothetical protein CEXT_514931 [Caerostris extrusa]|uniref:Uncharacterized protein n=1 Tax=Caerostris extrusa TaxID=172846 RepID=A0AAV4Y3L1_CAEEX|nr:hypothetical protein CEXT_514931 [Caerostris extrusa]